MIIMQNVFQCMEKLALVVIKPVIANYFFLNFLIKYVYCQTHLFLNLFLNDLKLKF